MAETRTISKANSPLPEYADFFRLRQEGISHLEELSTSLWTDFNLHDPGITMLEVLCYALTDLGYRNAFDIQRLLAPPIAEAGKADPNFFTAAEILSCNPVSLLDYRKLLLDVAGVRNAWLEPAQPGESEVPVYLDPDSPTVLSYDQVRGEESQRLPIRGLYRVCLELDPAPVRDACGNEYLEIGKIVQSVRDTLHQHRNLSEDFLDIVVMEEEAIAVCGGIELTPAADPEEVLTEIYLKLDAFLSPRLTYHRLQELVEQGKSMEEIFAGRPYRYHPLQLEELVEDPACLQDEFDLRPYHPDSFGFIDTDELAALTPQTELHASDFYRLIMDVPGVAAITSLSLLNYFDGLAQSQGDAWCLHVPPKHSPVLSLEHSRFTFFKQGLPFLADEDLVKQQFLERRTAHTKAKLSRNELDRVLPPVPPLDLADYPSVQHELPQTYGIGDEGLPATASAERKAQARQLKGYLTFFDQLLADYLAQLAHVRDLFSLEKEDCREVAGTRRSYFSQPLLDLPRAAEIIRHYQSCDSQLAGEEVPIDYPAFLQFITENESQYLNRRNRFLDHLLARFSEDFTDYVLLMYQLKGKTSQQRGIVQDKIDFLRTYPNLSRNRGRAFNYHLPGESWNTENVSGFKQRVAKLLGMDDARRRSYSHCQVVQQAGGYHWQLWQEDRLLLQSAANYPQETEAETALETALDRILLPEAYLSFRQDEHTFRFEVLTESQQTLAVHPTSYPSAAQAEQARWEMLSFLRGKGLPLTVQAATECFFYQVWQLPGEQLLWLAAQGFPTEAASQADYDTSFQQAAADLSHYQKEKLGEEFGFFLVDQDDILATHPSLYPDEFLRDLARKRAYYAWNGSGPTCHTPGTPGTYRFALNAPDGGETWLESIQTFHRVEAAKAAFNRFLPLVGSRVYYHLLDDLPAPDRYSFEIWNRKGERIATHSKGYPTACERDLVIETILHFMSKELCLKTGETEAGAWRFWLENEEEKLLLEGIETFPKEEKAQAALQELEQLTAQSEAYHKQDDLGGDCPFGFVLQQEGQDYARHPHTYETAAERDRAIQSLVLCVTYPHPICELTGDAGAFGFWWGEPEAEDALDSLLVSEKQDFRDPEEALRACEDLRREAQLSERYEKLSWEAGGFGFQLLDEDGELLAHHQAPAGTTPFTYATEAERDAVIELIITLAQATENRYRQDIANPEGAFFPTLYDETGSPMWRGTIVLGSEAEAESEAETLLTLAKDESNYLPWESPAGVCRFGFGLLKNGHLVAQHPRSYPSAEARDQAMETLLTYLCATDRQRNIIPQPTLFRFSLENQGETVLLGQSFPSTEEAETACKTVRALTTDPLAYQLTEVSPEEYHVEVKVGDQPGLARMPQTFADRASAEAALAEWLIQAQLNGHRHGFIATEEGHQSQLLTPDDTLLNCLTAFPTEEEALGELIRLFPLLKEVASYEVDEDPDTCRFEIRLGGTGEESWAIYSETYEERAAAEAQVELLAHFFGQSQVFCQVEETEHTFGARLMGQEGMVLLREEGTHKTEAKAIEAYEAMLAQVALASVVEFEAPPSDHPHFLLTYDNAQCQFSFDLRDETGKKIGTPPSFFSSRQQMYDHLGEIQEIAREKAVIVQVGGTPCGYYLHLPVELEAEDPFVLQSLQRFPTEAWAWEQGNAWLPWIDSTDYWWEERTEGEYLALVDAAGEWLLSAATSVAKTKVLEWIRAFPSLQDSALATKYSPPSYQAELRREADQVVLLRTARGIPWLWAKAEQRFENPEAQTELLQSLGEYLRAEVRQDELIDYVVAQDRGFGFQFTYVAPNTEA
ncbi:MAG: hypothetical protein AAF399_04420, partial [Bacteroidota bacterium]